MDRDRQHLPLPIASSPLTRRKRPAPTRPRGDRASHGAQILEEAAVVSIALLKRAAPPLAGLNPANIFKLQLVEGRQLDDDQIRLMGLSVLSKTPGGAIIVGSPDSELTALLARLSSYAAPNGPKYGEFDSVESISVIEANDRIGHRLRQNPVKMGEIAALDVELWRWDEKSKCTTQLSELQMALQDAGMSMPDYWLGEGICIARIKVDAETLKAISEWPAIKEIERRPEPEFSVSEYLNLTANDLTISPLPENPVGILVFDSGVTSGHPLLQSFIGDAQVFSEAFIAKHISGTQDDSGHGTCVAGLAVYGNCLEAIRSGVWKPHAQLFSARVLDNNSEYDDDSLIETQFEKALLYFLENYPSIRIVNLSLGSCYDKLGESRHQLRFAAVLDEIAWRYRDREVVFVVAAGNIPDPSNSEIEEVAENYPHYLMDQACRLTDPASSALALTIGGISCGIIANYRTEGIVSILVSGGKGNPSPFTRIGPGFNNAIKPELVEEAGDYVIEAGGIYRRHGVLSLNRDIATSLLTQRHGSSFAAPLVANMAARISQAYPQHSSNLVRALLVHSARIPSQRPDYFPANNHAPENLKTYGYGRPFLDTALAAAGNDAWLLNEGTISLDSFLVFELPGIPAEFVSTKGKRRLAVTVAFDPPTRASRADSYLGVTMEYSLWKNISLVTLQDAFRNWNRDEKEALEDGVPPGLTGLPGKIDLVPKSGVRNTSTVQHSWVELQKAGNLVPESPLYLVLVCQRKWAPAEIENQRYSVVMSISHEDKSIDLHAALRLQPKIQAILTARGRAQS